MIAHFRFNHHVDAALFVFLDNRQRASGRLQERRQLCFYKAPLLIWIADMPERWTHVEGAARLAFEKHVVPTQVNLSRFASSAQLLQVTVAELSLFVSLVANGLCVCDPLGDGNRLSC